MDTHFAPAERSGPDELVREIQVVSEHEVINGLLKIVSGLLAILNDHRQILTVNYALLRWLGVQQPEKAIGLRPGEVIHCVHSEETEGGCGTSRYCSSCGAAIAIVASLGADRPEERLCAATVQKNGVATDLCLRVKSSPITIEGRRFLLLFIQDITTEWRRASLERVFFHDISNIVTGLVGVTSILNVNDPEFQQDLIARTQHLVARLVDEVAIQKTLTQALPSPFDVRRESLPLQKVQNDMTTLFANHPAAQGKRLVVPEMDPHLRVETDPALLIRVLANMLTNAFEASQEGDEVRLSARQNDQGTTFTVWNRQPIPANLTKRVFQRHFTTKEGEGRGFGTYSMKLLGEGYLGGKLSFRTSDSEGTLFQFSLPRTA